MRGIERMTYDLTFDEAIDVLQSKIGWVQGENFDKNEYLAIDRVRNVFIKNVVDEKYFDCFGNTTTKQIWTDISQMKQDMRSQKYRFILVLNRDSVKGVGYYSKGNDRNSYLWHKRMNTRKSIDEKSSYLKQEVCNNCKNALKDKLTQEQLHKFEETFYTAAEGYLFKRKEH